jgi:phosphatidylethanolamine-binding protein (PEBP) family uncharacterized protein
LISAFLLTSFEVVVDIPGNKVEKGKQISHYIGPTPPACKYQVRASLLIFVIASGVHRYMFVLFKQPHRMGNIRNLDDHARGNWKLINFVKEHNLGEPVAYSYFLSEHEPHGLE